MTWGDKQRADPTAGVTLVPKPIICPRCGIVKGTTHNARRGLCVDCQGVLRLERGALALWTRAA